MKRHLSVLLIVAIAVATLSACDSFKSAAGPTDTPIITTFAADSLSIKIGTAATLRWDVSGGDVQVRIDPLVGNVPSTGSTQLVLTVTTTFTLNARAPSGASVQRVLTIVVTP